MKSIIISRTGVETSNSFVEAYILLKYITLLLYIIIIFCCFFDSSKFEPFKVHFSVILLLIIYIKMLYHICYLIMIS